MQLRLSQQCKKQKVIKIESKFIYSDIIIGGWLLNGDKRWIGNGNRDIMVVWAKNVENNKVQGFIVDLKAKGVKSEVIKHKLALRIVQNC